MDAVGKPASKTRKRAAGTKRRREPERLWRAPQDCEAARVARADRMLGYRRAMALPDRYVPNGWALATAARQGTGIPRTAVVVDLADRRRGRPEGSVTP